MELVLVVGSESGNAEMVADCVTDALTQSGHHVRTVRGGSLAASGILEARRVLVVCSTTGLGEIPQNLRGLFDELASSAASLAAIRFGVVGLGDRNYKETFLGGPRKWDALLVSLGAQRALPMLALDATDHLTPDVDAVAWLPSWLEAVG